MMKIFILIHTYHIFNKHSSIYEFKNLKCVCNLCYFFNTTYLFWLSNINNLMHETKMTSLRNFTVDPGGHRNQLIGDVIMESEHLRNGNNYKFLG